MAAFAPAIAPVASRRGKNVVVPRGSSLPALCIKCGAPASVPWRKKFYWHSPWLYFMILFPGLLIYALVALVVRKKIELNVPLCEEHHAERKRYNIIGGVLLGAIIPVSIAGANISSLEGYMVALVAIIMFIAGAVFLSRGSNYIYPKRIDENQAILAGAGSNFLNGLPEQVG